MQSEPALKNEVLASSTADDVAQIARKLPKRLIVTNQSLMLVVAQLWPLKKRRIEYQFGSRPLMGVDVNATTIAGALQGLLASVVLAP